MTFLDGEQLTRAYHAALSSLLAERLPEGYWTGELSTSALSTATAVMALALVQKQTSASGRFDDLISGGIAWLAAHQNPDGGWGDTVKSLSNISTSMLVRAALPLTGSAGRYGDCLKKLDEYILKHCGRTPEEQAAAVKARYGKDRTFAVPILTTCALAGLVSWREVTPLPFELACFPQSWFRFLRLPVVSYALPALIAIGQVIYHHRPPREPVTRLVRRLAIPRSLRVLEAIQPSSGGFLEATPLTSFVTLSLASCGQAGHPVVRRGVEFLVHSVRPDGSWPIDSNLSVWVTTLAVNALAAAGELSEAWKQLLPWQVRELAGAGLLPRGLDNATHLAEWLVKQQFRTRHPYTGADPGGWGWTHLPGSVPDADDTPGALLALHHLHPDPDSARAGVGWLLDLQNSDGGWPTFCRGWGNLPFDRSGTDLTAHALRALDAWKSRLIDPAGLFQRAVGGPEDIWPNSGRRRPPSKLQRRIERSISRGFDYLARSQRADGSWVPLWFGNQFAPADENPTYGTARVLAAYRDLDKMNTVPALRGVAWLRAAQNAGGGWGGAAGVPSSVEETALALDVLLAAGPDSEPAVNKGLAWLVEQVESGGLQAPTPIGFYFAKLWYFEKLYPITFAVAALGRACRIRADRPAETHREPPP